MGQQGPPTPFPEQVDTITVRLPLPTIPQKGRDPISEVGFDFIRTDERSYISREGGVIRYMSAASYEAETVFGKPYARAAFVVNSYTGNVNAALRLALTEVARGYAMAYAYTKQRPPLPMPPNPGFGHPYSRQATLVLDGSSRLRGFCAGLHSLDGDLVQETTVAFDAVFARETEPPPQQ